MTHPPASCSDAILASLVFVVLAVAVGRWMLLNQTDYREFKVEKSLRSIVGFTILSLAFAFPKYATSPHISFLLGGLGLGVIVGVVGLSLTRFDLLNVGKYAPSPLIAFLVVFPLAGSVPFSMAAPYLPPAIVELAGGTRTVVLLAGIVFGYFISYYTALWIKFRNLPKSSERTKTLPETKPSSDDASGPLRAPILG